MIARLRSLALATACVAASALSAHAARAEDERPKAPELLGGEDWIGTDRDLRLADFKGKVLLLDFWTFG